LKKTPFEQAAQQRQFLRRLEYERQARKAGRTPALFGYALMLIGLAISLVGGYVPGGGKIPLWVGLGFLIPALPCFVISILDRLRWKRLHPFKG
jgi:hypothetical protein